MLPPLAGQPSTATVTQEIRGATPLRIVEQKNGRSRLVCSSDGDASIVYRWA